MKRNGLYSLTLPIALAVSPMTTHEDVSVISHLGGISRYLLRGSVTIELENLRRVCNRRFLLLQRLDTEICEVIVSNTLGMTIL